VETEFWPIEDQATSPVYDLFVLIVHCFRIPLFFVLSGFFASMVWERRGAWGFVAHRTKRLVLPFVAGMAVIVPLVHVAWVYGTTATDPSHPALAGEVMKFYREHFRHAVAWGSHLWFLYYLILYSAVLAAGHGLADRVPQL